MTEITPKTFSIVSHAAGTKYGTREYSFYTDQESLYKATLLDREINAILDTELIAKLEVELDAVLQELVKSKLTIHMQGIPRKVRRQIYIAAQNMPPEKSDYLGVALVMAHITHITDADGNVDDTRWTYETGQEWIDPLSESDFNNLMDLVSEMQIDSAKFDSNVTADFLSKS